MLLIGLTGSIGMGKSTIAKRFGDNGVPVVDADAIVHELYRGAAVAPIEQAFGHVTRDGAIDRAALSAKLVGNDDAFKRLEEIVHPLVFQSERAKLIAFAEAGSSMAVLEVPLLFETGGDARVDYSVVVSAPAAVQRERVMSRPGMSAEKFEAILARQLPDAEKRERADFVVDTGLDISESHAQVDEIISSLRLRKGTAFARVWHGLADDG